MTNLYQLPDLPYDYNALEPHISEKLLKIHHDKHHQGYVNKANKILKQLDKAREENQELNQKNALKFLSFAIGGHVLHSLFWPNLSPDGGGKPTGVIKEAIDKEFGSFERFKQEFNNAAAVEGSGWVALTYCQKTNRPIIMQIEKHNVNLYPQFKILMVLDLWEHAFYLDYENNKGKFLEAFWKIVNWDEVNKRFKEIKS